MNFSFDNLECHLAISDQDYWNTCCLKANRQGEKDFSKLMRSTAVSFQQFLNGKYGKAKYILDISFERSEYIQGINLEHRNIDKDTDVLSFPLQESLHGLSSGESEFPVPLGDICISLDQAQVQAKELGVGLFSELIHLQVHGFLHLVGYDHEVSLEEEKIMEEMERRLITNIQNIYSRI